MKFLKTKYLKKIKKIKHRRVSIFTKTIKSVYIAKHITLKSKIFNFETLSSIKDIEKNEVRHQKSKKKLKNKKFKFITILKKINN